MPVRVQDGLVVKRFAPLALMPIAAFAVHQLRYWLAFGGRAGVALAAQGHSYLHSVVPWLIMLVALFLGEFLRALGRAWAGKSSLPRTTFSFAALWLLCVVTLLAIYVAQESLEGLVATGHPGGLAGIFGFGGWWAVPAASAVGLVLAAVFHGAGWVLHAVAARVGRPPHRRPSRGGVPRRPGEVLAWPPAPLADGSSGRGPPR